MNFDKESKSGKKNFFYFWAGGGGGGGGGSVVEKGASRHRSEVGIPYI